MYLVRRHAYRLLRKAVKELSCSHCDHKFNKGYNYKRHLAVIHGVNEFGQPTSVAERECYQELARKEARKRKLASCTTTSDEPKVDEPQQEPASRACTDEPSPYPTPAYGPPSTSGDSSRPKRTSTRNPRIKYVSFHHVRMKVKKTFTE